MSDPKKVIAQNSGFVVAENKRALEDLERARAHREQGNATAAKSFDTAAKTHIDRAARAAATIFDRNKNG